MQVKSIAVQRCVPFGSTVISSMDEYGLAPLFVFFFLGGGGAESASLVKAAWNCLLLLLALPFASVLRIPFSVNEVVPSASFIS